MVHHVVDDVVDRVIDPLDHAGEHKPRLHHVLIGIHADDEVRRATVLFSLLLDRVKRTETRIARRGKDHVRAFADLGQRQLFAFAGIVPRAVSHADVVFDHANVRIYRLRSFFITFREPMNQTDVHAAEETDRAGLRLLRRENPDEIRTFVFLEDERGDVRQIADAVDDREVNVWIVFRDGFHDRRLGETDTDD